jgi:putative transposase
MVRYRRNRLSGATYFFTVALENRKSTLLTTHINDLRSAFRISDSKKPFTVDAAVILPEHCHVLMTLPENDSDYPGRWRSIKSCFTKSLVKRGVPIKKNHRGEYNLWQRRYWEHTIRDALDWENHLSYIHFNPVKHGLVKRVRDWPHSSFHRFVDEGKLSADWGGEYQESERGYGE